MKKLKSLALIISIISLFSSCYMTKKSESYYGIETASSKKIVYVIDISGSMEGKAETNLQGKVLTTAGSKVGSTVGNKIGGTVGNIISKQTNNQLTKLGKAKKELMPSIRGLSEDSYFTIIVFENSIKRFNKSLVQANNTNKNLAIAYLEKLESGGGTNMGDAIEDAFGLAGAGAKDANANLELDAIFVLGDGDPNEGKYPSPDQILTKVSEWNSAKRVKIHTIGLGEDCNKEFMKKLADQNGGQFVDK